MGHLWKMKQLPAFDNTRKPQIILIGNGLNQAFNERSWEDLIRNALSNNSSCYSYEDIQSIPATMQIVIAASEKCSMAVPAKGGIRKEIQTMTKEMLVDKMDKKCEDLYRALLALPVDSILTTNYSNEFEFTANRVNSLYSFRKYQARTKEVKGIKEQFRIFQYSNLYVDGQVKPIWHIHGDISKPDSIVIGHYFYGKLLRQIEDRVPEFMKSFNGLTRKGLSVAPKSWVDYFLAGDIYVLGLTMDSVEQDLWWLLSCKKRLFPDSKVYYYSPKGRCNPNVRKMLIAYGASIEEEIPLVKKENYVSYYEKAIQSISKKIEEAADVQIHH